MRFLKDVDDVTGKKPQKKAQKDDYYGFTLVQISALMTAVGIFSEKLSSGIVSVAKYFRCLYEADPKHFEEKFGFKPKVTN